MAGCRIMFRKVLDLLSAAVYLVTMKTDCFKAVLKAHKEYRQLMQRPSKEQVAEYVREFGDKAEVKGIYRKWIVLSSLLKGSAVAESIRMKDFYKF